MNVRWIIRRDLEECTILDPEWTAEDFVQALRKRNVIGMVSERQIETIPGYPDLWIIEGFAIWELHSKEGLKVLRIQGNKDGVIALLEKMKQKARSKSVRYRVYVNLPLKVKLANAAKACGYRALGCTPQGEIRFTWAEVDEKPADDLADDILKHMAMSAYQERLDNELGDAI